MPLAGLEHQVGALDQAEHEHSSVGRLCFWVSIRSSHILLPPSASSSRHSCPIISVPRRAHPVVTDRSTPRTGMTSRLQRGLKGLAQGLFITGNLCQTVRGFVLP